MLGSVAGLRSHPEVRRGAARRRGIEWERPHTLSWRSALADDAEWMSGKSRNRLAPVLTGVSSWTSDRRTQELIPLPPIPQLGRESQRTLDFQFHLSPWESKQTRSNTRLRALVQRCSFCLRNTSQIGTSGTRFCRRRRTSARVRPVPKGKVTRSFVENPWLPRANSCLQQLDRPLAG
jgi:hypothetical protein